MAEKAPITDIFALNTVYAEVKERISERVSKTSYDVDEVLGSNDSPYSTLYVTQISEGSSKLKINSSNLKTTGSVNNNEVTTVNSAEVIVNNNLGVTKLLITPHIKAKKVTSEFFEVVGVNTYGTGSTGVGMQYNTTTKGIDFIC